jgi:hypothetical protein
MKKRDQASLAEEARIARLEAFAESLVSKRKEAVDGRASSGIEQTWREDEEFYDGIDDVNREEIMSKATTLNAGLTTTRNAKAVKSTVFVNITQPYVDMASARVADMLLPTDDMPFSVENTPMPDVLEATRDTSTTIMLGGRETPIALAAKKMIEQAAEKAKKAETRIWDWLVESQWHSEVRQVIEDAARIGTGILKGPFPIKCKTKAMNRLDDGTVELKIVEKTKPACKRIDPRKFYPDPGCGRSIHNGSFTWEEDDITARQLREMKGSAHSDRTPLYIDSQIDMVLQEGPQKKYLDKGVDKSDSDVFKIWYYHGIADADDLRAAGCECEDDKILPVMVTMVNDRVVAAKLSTLDSGEFPYDVFVWQRRANAWHGKGVSRQVRTPQRMLNAATRNMMDNAGLCSGPIIIVREGLLSTQNGEPFELRPRTILTVPEDTDVGAVRDAIHSITIESRQVELMNIIKYAMELAEKVTNMPLLMQGQQEPNAETLGGTQIRNNNASVVLRRTAKIFDDDITIPKINRYYEWLLLYGEDPDEKGDYVIRAKGSTALYERDAQNQAILQMGALVKDPAFKINPEKWIVEAFKAQRLDPSRFQYTDDEWQEVQAKMAENGPPADPRIEAAKINADAGIKKAQISAEVIVAKTKADTDRDTTYVHAEQERTLIMHEAKMTELEQRERLAMLEYANREKVTLEQVKAKLASDVMKLKTQEKLAMTPPSGAPQVATSPTEPRGRAPNGEAFQK